MYQSTKRLFFLTLGEYLPNVCTEKSLDRYSRHNIKEMKIKGKKREHRN